MALKEKSFINKHVLLALISTFLKFWIFSEIFLGGFLVLILKLDNELSLIITTLFSIVVTIRKLYYFKKEFKKSKDRLQNIDYCLELKKLNEAYIDVNVQKYPKEKTRKKYLTEIEYIRLTKIIKGLG